MIRGPGGQGLAIHLIIVFCYVATGVAAALVLPQATSLVRADFAAGGALIGVLAAANIHFFIVQSERLRRLQDSVVWLRNRFRDMEQETADLGHEFKTVATAQHDGEVVGAERIAQTVDEVKVLQGLIERFIQNQRARDKRARLDALTSANHRLPPAAVSARAAQTPARHAQAAGRRTEAPRRRGFPEPEEFTVPERE